MHEVPVAALGTQYGLPTALPNLHIKSLLHQELNGEKWHRVQKFFVN
jgi:hypothetical protein